MRVQHGSDLKPEKGAEHEPKKDPAQILEQEIKESQESIERLTPQLFVSGLSAGLDVGFSLLCMAIM